VSTATTVPASAPSPTRPRSTPPWCTTTSAPTAAVRGRGAVPVPAGRGIDQLLGGDPGTVGERLVRFFLRIGEDQANRHAVIGLLRSAATTEHAATLLREFASEAIIGGMAADLDPLNPRLRPTLVASQLIGLFMLRYIIKVEPLASASVEEVVAAVAPTVQRYLTAELNLQPSV
jgi:Tetracyclin repressor-like, C-terminal domain